MNRIASYPPEAEGFENSAPGSADNLGTGDSSKIEADSPSCTPEQAEGEKQVVQVAHPVRDSGRDSLLGDLEEWQDGASAAFDKIMAICDAGTWLRFEDVIDAVKSAIDPSSTVRQSIEIKIPEWWPENPYPESVFRMTDAEYVAAIPDENLRTAISGYCARLFFGIASREIFKAYKNHFQIATPTTEAKA